jgi:RNA polymerase sporulation-specific sigma factor
MKDVLTRAREGDELAFQTLLREYRPFLYAIARRHYAPGLSNDDLRQEARWGFWKAVRDYRDEAGIPFAAFADLVVKRHVATAVITAHRQKHKPLGFNANERRELPAVLEVVEAVRGDPVAALESKERIRQVFDALGGLTDLEREAVIMTVLQGESYEYAAEMLCADCKSIDNAVQRARRKLAGALA